ncbi:MAG: hypothetical protein LBE67_09210 [Kocuria palustris]|nr:hypothetical protein [Kocuria palustris]
MSPPAPSACLNQAPAAALGTDFARIVVGIRQAPSSRRPDPPATVLGLPVAGGGRRAIPGSRGRSTRCARDDPPTRRTRRPTADRAPHARTRGARAQK